MSIRYPAGRITLSIDPLAVPDAATSVTASATGATTASVAFTAPTNTGVSAITSYSVVSSAGGTVATGAASPISVTGLSTDTAYTFQVSALNSAGVGPITTSNSVRTSKSILLAQYAASNNNLVSYPFSPDTGYGTRYLGSTGATAGTASAAVYSPSNQAVLVANTSGNGKIVALAWNAATGFGTKYADPSPVPATNIYSVVFSPQGTVAFGYGPTTSPYVHAYAWSDVTGFGTKYSNPATIPPPPGTNNNCIAVTRTGNTVIVGGNTLPYLAAYPWSDSTGFGVKFSDPAVAMTGTIYSVAFNPASTVVAAEGNNILTAYQFSETTGFGTQYTTLNLGTTHANNITFHPSGAFVMCSSTSNTGFRIYPWSDSTGFGTVSLTGSTATNWAAWSPDGTLITTGINSSPYIRTYPWSTVTNTVGTVYANPASLPTTTTGVNSTVFNS